MIVRILFFLFCFAVSTSMYGQQDNTYVVKKKDTVYGIAKKYGVTIDQLTDANPGLDAAGTQLKKGMTLVIPQPTNIVSEQPKSSSSSTTDAIRVGVMLPLHYNDGDGRRMTEYYRGILMACENLKREGFSVDIRAWNVDINADEDDDGEQYRMEDYHILSMDSLDSPCVDNGIALSEKDVPWVGRQMWAPDAVKVNGKYYLVFPAKDKEEIFRIGVAVSDSPVGPFVPQDNYIEGSIAFERGSQEEIELREKLFDTILS